ncbi:MAG: hypothetical protein M0P39_11565 [Rhodocyclaceae bacterium]|nr:hypothetical protein [Rhodocyclaceae bacterium]
MDKAAFAICPKCRHRRTPEETADPGVCPACGLVFAKWLARDSFVPPSLRKRVQDDDEPVLIEEAAARLLDAAADVPPEHLWGRAAIWAGIAVWAVRIALNDYRGEEALDSFMHLTVILFHEAGHILFMPFGEFMTVLGGSLFQVLMPLIAAAAMLIQQRDPFAAGLGLWWAGASLVDISSYIHDAADPVLPLIGGGTGTDRFHDWIFLLDSVGRTARSPLYAAWVHGFGIMVMLAGLAWAAAVLWRQKRRRRDASPPPAMR